MKIRVKKVLFLMWILIALGGGFFFAPSASADKVQFSQKIMPVAFVYMGKNQEIVDVWNNISQNDDAYVLKFFDASNKKELALTNDLIARYAKQKASPAIVESNKSVKFENENGVITQIVTIT